MRCAVLRPTLNDGPDDGPPPDANWFPVGSFTELSMHLFS